jgi:uncharacterized glyoxalase superfamily protein PhnB
MRTASERGWPTVYPHLRYAAPEDAIDWLVRVFGFREVARASRPDRLIVSELEGPGGGTVMVAALDDPFRDFIHQRIPEARHLDVVPFPWLAGSISMAVADVDAHYRVAVAEGATTLDAPTDQPWGIRTYAALDIEGHQWQFAQQIRLVAPEDWGAVRR